jgi:hypothetical protein
METFGIIHILEGVLGWLSRSGYADAGTDIEQALHIHIATVLSSAIWLVDQSGKELGASPKPSQAACSGSCASVRRKRLQPTHVLWSEVLVGGLVIFTMHVNLILNILDLYSFIVIYCDYWKVEYDSTFSKGSALALPCFCAFPVIATEHPLCRIDEEPGK